MCTDAALKGITSRISDEFQYSHLFFQASSQSVPCKSVLISRTREAQRKRSALSDGDAGSRKVSFVFDDASALSNVGLNKTRRVDPNPDLERALNAQLELARQAGEMDDFISSANNLNNEGVKSFPPMIQNTRNCIDLLGQSTQRFPI